MAGRDYLWLVASVKSWTRRSDLEPFIPDLIMLAEDRMSVDLEARGVDSLVTLPTVAGVSSLAHPSDGSDIRTVGLPNQPALGCLSADAFNARYSDGAQGSPRHYTIIGDALQLGPTPDAVYQLALSTRCTLPALTDATPTNWLILRNPSLYLAATVFEAMVNLRDAEGQAVWQAKYQQALAAANATKDSAGQLVVRSDAPTP